MKNGKKVKILKDRILMILLEDNKSAGELAEILGVSPDTARNRLRELRADRKVRISDWIVKETTMTAQYGLGSGHDRPRPARVRAEGTRRNGGETGRTCRMEAVRPVRFRREGMDEWLFRIRELR